MHIKQYSHMIGRSNCTEQRVEEVKSDIISCVISGLGTYPGTNIKQSEKSQTIVVKRMPPRPIAGAAQQKQHRIEEQRGSTYQTDRVYVHERREKNFI